MTDRPNPAPGADLSARRPERRRNAALRELIDEMLVSIRTAVNRELWTAEERAQYEGELATIMTRVRTEAVGAQGADRERPGR